MMTSGCQEMLLSGVYVVEVWAELLSGGEVEVRAGLSDGSFLLLHRTDEDLAHMMKMLVDGFLEDRETLSSNLLTGLLRVRAADQISDVQVKTVELNNLLKTLIHLPRKFSQSKAVLAFFEPRAVDQIFRREQDYTSKQEVDHTVRPADQSIRQVGQESDQSIRQEDRQSDQSIRQEDQQSHQCFRPVDQELNQSIREGDQGVDQSIRRRNQDLDQFIRQGDQEEDQSIRQRDQDPDVFQSPEVLSEVWMSNGFCLANTETILFDLTPPTPPVAQSDDSRRGSVAPAVCLQLCHPSLSPHLLRGFTGMIGRMNRLSHRQTLPAGHAASMCCTSGRRRRTSWTE